MKINKVSCLNGFFQSSINVCSTFGFTYIFIILQIAFNQMGAQCTHGDAHQMKFEGLDYTQNNFEERIAEIKQFMTLTNDCTKSTPINLKEQGCSVTQFQIDQYIGKGALGKVYTIIQNSTDDQYAMKVINKQKLFQNNVGQLQIQSIDHPFITKVKYVFQNMAKIYVIADYMPRGQLFYLIRSFKGKLEEEQAKFYAGEVFLAIQYLHSRKLFYRDLKPENILLDDDGHIKITDYGLLKYFNKQKSSGNSFYATPEYIAPEILGNKEWSYASDWFSFGAILFDMLTGKPPFYSKNQLSVKSQISIPSRLSPNAKSLLHGLLKIRPETRLGSKGSAQIRSHPFFDGLDFQKLKKRQIQPPMKEEVKENIFEDYDDKSSSCAPSLKSSKMNKSIKGKMQQQWKKSESGKGRNLSPSTTAVTANTRNTRGNSIINS